MASRPESWVGVASGLRQCSMSQRRQTLSDVIARAEASLKNLRDFPDRWVVCVLVRFLPHQRRPLGRARPRVVGNHL